ncbi:MAG: lamin tail domain-containing protein [Planctomycetota bacterium]
MKMFRVLSRAAFGLALLPPALSQTVHVSPAADAAAGRGVATLRLSDAVPGARAFLVDRTTCESLLDAHGLPQGRVIALRAVDAQGEATFPLPADAFALATPLAVVVAGPQGLALAGAVTLPPVLPVMPRVGVAQTRQIVVTEFMKDPTAVSDARGEWIELYNPSPLPVDVEGWVISDDGNDSTVLTNGGTGIFVPAYGLAVIARNGDPLLNGGVTPVATYSGVTLANGADQILLSLPNGTLVDAVRYLDGPTWPDAPGASVSLSPRAWRTGHDDVDTAWCEGESTMPGGDLGTPGTFNDTCWD